MAAIWVDSIERDFLEKRLEDLIKNKNIKPKYPLTVKKALLIFSSPLKTIYCSQLSITKANKRPIIDNIPKLGALCININQKIIVKKY